MGRVFSGSNDVIEVIIRDPGGAKIESRMANMQDKKEVKRLLYWLKYKYNIYTKETSDSGEFLKF